jgi:inositol oxygenase
VLVGLLHDLGKVLCLYGEPQWAVVGDTFPVGCRFSDRIVYHEYFALNPDASDARYTTRLGMYSEGCGLDQVLLSWGHDEYLYHVMKPYLPEPALYMIRFHSFYAWHREGQYDWLCNDHDREMLPWVQKFNPYDLYSKSPVPPDWTALRPFYQDLIAKYLPDSIAF